MTQAIALLRSKSANPREMIRSGLVLFCTLALIAAGPMLPL